MHVSRVTVSQAKAIRAYALDLEFVKCRGSIYARSAVFVPFSRIAAGPRGDSGAPVTPAGQRNVEMLTRSGSTPQLTKLLERPIVLELRPEVTLSLAEPLPCGHLLHEMIASRFVPTPALTEVVKQFQCEAERELESYRVMRKTLRKLRIQEMRVCGKVENIVKMPTGDAPDSSSGAMEAERFVDDGNDSLLPSLSDCSSLSSSAFRVAPSAVAAAMRALQRRVGVVHNFRGLDPYAVPNVRVFDRHALELLHAAPVQSEEFKQASQHLRRLSHVGRGRNGYKPLTYCIRTHPEFMQKVLQTVFESPSAWYEWLTACYTRVEEDLRSVRAAHCAGAHGQVRLSDLPSCARSNGDCGYGDSNTLPATQMVDFLEFDALEDLATEMNRVWGKLLREGVRDANKKQADAASPQPPKVFVYGSADLGVIRTTLALSRSPATLKPKQPERRYKTGRFSAKRPTESTAVVPGASFSNPAQDAGEAGEKTPDIAVQLISPYEARVVDITKHPLFTAAGFTSSPQKALSLSAALEKATLRDATAAALYESQRQHDPLWDAQALACICSVAGAVR
ncbi:hypothetical protein ABL78_5059 [Leptomonas seymouri]|uniref:Uncharacterized protein n=1 Tax=Leptomonas seymouri TaxID=5684 RepID=A0A0N1I2P3_LEPSE|nr:hypothetical protein ABL78_5059 [Leptomonas seymouri]|eukprot:KPI85878.1 hypothetical protein ABL78_5059 [Leptomonas seymouri]